ncbi:hypothetical protein FM105_14055 [Brevibacterium yomogidense]|uniref:Uncharacterized protein n=1 Tax=Brevibacterium yomogidense TaxID=946573 RepID=A0A1X6XPG4_9MICO|nr:hypothetical protein FM105_14055 [Brevibacterium yomogidense]
MVGCSPASAVAQPLTSRHAVTAAPAALTGGSFHLIAISSSSPRGPQSSVAPIGDRATRYGGIDIL